ncbi:sulfurtransferase TusA family protein [Candidatus Sumerlaeota bacterium]|nr:sulfurtransferase TusA family protein [Candidatus Sumerlaeota bacterium]
MGIMGLPEPESPRPDQVVDARGSLCPDPLLAAQHALSEMETGEVLELISDDRRSRSTVCFWAMKAGHTCPDVSATGTDTVRLFIRRRR